MILAHGGIPCGMEAALLAVLLGVVSLRKTIWANIRIYGWRTLVNLGWKTEV